MKRSVEALIVVLILACAPLFAGKLKVSKDLKGLDPNKEVDVIVQFKQAPDQEAIEKVEKKKGQGRRFHHSSGGGRRSSGRSRYRLCFGGP